MNIIVCIKQVVDTNDIKWTKNNTIDRDGAVSIINPCDVLAIQTALKLKDENTSITVITMGPPQAKEALKTALAMGCDEAYLLSDKKFSGADTVATSKTLTAAIKHIKPDFDLIICGQFASDGDTAQTGPSIAQKLDIEQITYVNEIARLNKAQKTIEVIREADDYIEIISAPFPVLICVNNCPYEEPIISIDGYIKSQNTLIKTLNADDLNLSREDIGIKGSPTWVSKAFRATSDREKKVLKLEDLNNNSAVEVLQETLHRTTNTIKNEIEKVEYHKFDKNKEEQNKILIWGEVDNCDNLRDVVFQLASKANILAQKVENCKISVLSAGKNTQSYLDTLSKYGVDELITLVNPLLSEYNTLNYAKTILAYLEQYPTNIFLLGATKQGRDLAPQISSALNTGLTADCTELEIYDDFKLAATRPTFGGELMATILCKTQPQMATVRTGVFKAIQTNSNSQINHKIFDIKIDKPSLKKILKRTTITKDENTLERAKIVFVGGKGLKNKQYFDKLNELAKILNVKVGATRKAVDAGFASRDIQIGQTGKTISPDLYVAFGVSGAIQHYVGIEKAKKIIAINTNENAPIIKNADLTIIADAQKIIDEWLEKLK